MNKMLRDCSDRVFWVITPLARYNYRVTSLLAHSLLLVLLLLLPTSIVLACWNVWSRTSDLTSSREMFTGSSTMSLLVSLVYISWYYIHSIQLMLLAWLQSLQCSHAFFCLSTTTNLVDASSYLFVSCVVRHSQNRDEFIIDDLYHVPLLYLLICIKSMTFNYIWLSYWHIYFFSL